MQLSELQLFIIIFVSFFFIIIAYLGAVNGIIKLKEHFKKRKKALSIIGKDAIRYGDKGAKLAYKGIMKFFAEKYNGAAEYFEDALKLNLHEDNKAFCFEWLSHCYYKQGKLTDYKKIRKRAAQALATNDNALTAYGACLADDGDFENAIYYYNQALKYNPNNCIAYRTLGLIEQSKGNYDKAIEYFDTALKVSGQDVLSLYEKAVCLAAKGDYKEAEALMTQAVAADEEDRYEKYKNKVHTILKISEHDLFQEEGSTDS